MARPRTALRRRVHLGILAGLVVWASVSWAQAADREARIRARERSIDLPALQYAYAAQRLPDHFRTPAVRRADATPRDNRTTDEGALLGRILFYDTRLSADDTQSCATCHRQENAFADPRRFSRGIHGDVGRRNAMALANLRYHRGGLFWDERSPTLEAQVLEPIQDPAEMAYDLEALVERLGDDPNYAVLFTLAFGDPEVTSDRIARALAQFVRAIVSYRSKFDEGMARVESVNDDFPNFSRLENEGKDVFLGRHDAARGPSCASCHLLGAGGRSGPGGPGDGDDAAGTVALFAARAPGNNGLDRETSATDRGVAEVTDREADEAVFRIPSLRNLELTAPYMHDGRFRTLKQVLDHYRKGVQPHPNLDPRLAGRRGGVRGIDMSVRERNALIAFLKTLTDRPLTEDPKLSNPWR